ncbi:MAG: hypothetical protein ABIP88_03305 [Candidatus Binatia bacterium]
MPSSFLLGQMILMWASLIPDSVGKALHDEANGLVPLASLSEGLTRVVGATGGLFLGQ